MTRDEALRSARLLMNAEHRTACVFRRPGRGKKPADWISGSAYAVPPKGYRLAMYVSVTGLDRVVDSSDAGGSQ